jgi:K+-sensing histidine kinase KdpD
MKRVVARISLGGCQLGETRLVCASFNSEDEACQVLLPFVKGGIGIGLSVSRSSIETHHGRPWAKLNGGPGATFSFSIPRGPVGPPVPGWLKYRMPAIQGNL